MVNFANNFNFEINLIRKQIQINIDKLTIAHQFIDHKKLVIENKYIETQ